jgi:3-dehydroquinate synthetase
MIVEGRIAERVGILSRNSVHQITALLLLFGLPIRVPHDLKISDILKATQQDKKAVGSKINYTLLSKLGKGAINVALSIQDVKRALED